jgi:hypothetical protein
MKNFLIIVLSLALAAAAFATRPSEPQFRVYLKGGDPASAAAAAVAERGTAGQKIFKILGRLGGEEPQARDYTFRDCYLWVDVQREGRTVYVGAFAHYFDVSRFGGGTNGTGAESSPKETQPAADEQPAPAVASARTTGSRHGRRGS